MKETDKDFREELAETRDERLRHQPKKDEVTELLKEIKKEIRNFDTYGFLVLGFLVIIALELGLVIYWLHRLVPFPFFR